MTLASGPTSTRRRSVITAARIWRAARSGDVSAIRSNCRRASSRPPATSATLGSMRALRAMLVLIPPGCTVVADTGAPSIRSSIQRVSVKPRTANLAALYAPWPGTLISPKTLEVDDVTLAGRLQMGQERLGPVHHAPEVDG